MAQISNCLKLLSKIDERDQDALVARLDELQAQGLPAERAQIQAAIDVLTSVQGESSESNQATALASKARAAIKSGVTETPEFKKWFGDSKVVDAEGKPQVVYHGTVGDFAEFNGPGSRDSSAVQSLGDWFASTPRAAEKFAIDPEFQDGDGANIMPVYLSIKNPKVILGGWRGLEKAAWPNGYDENSIKAWRQSLLQAGHDGIELRNSKTDGGGLRTDYVAFRPEQIKSAIGNSGTFDPNAPDITRSATRAPAGVEIVEVEDGFDAMKDGKRIGRLRDNLPRGAAEQLDENASVDIVKVEPEFKGQGVGSALYEAFNEKHGGRIAPSGKTSPEAWALWKRKFPEKVDAFVAAEASRIADGADQAMVIRNISDTEVARRVAEAAPETVIRSASRQTDTPEFKRWFGDSKVVGADGKPLVVYHGTRRPFNEFSPSKPMGAPGNPEGVYFTADKGVAEEYAQDADGAWDEKSRVVSAYIKIENDADGKIIDSAYRGREYAVFKAENIKSAIGNSGAFDPTSPDITRSAARPEFFSQLQRAIEQVPDRLATMAAPQWKLWLDANAPKLGVKKDEIEWSGIGDYLKLRGKDKVASDELVAYLADSGVRVQEVVLGGGRAENVTLVRDSTRQDAWGEVVVYRSSDGAFVVENGIGGKSWSVQDAESYDSDYSEDDGSYAGDFKSREAAELFINGQTRAQNRDYDGVGSSPETKYGTYTVPGGENYREVLITLPEREPNFAVDDFIDAMVEKYGPEAIYDIDGNVRTLKQSFPKMLTAEDQAGFDRASAEADADPVISYTSNHWTQKNILAHLRVDDRVDADGNKVLFLQEIQSDWGQDGKKKGFNNAGLPPGHEVRKISVRNPLAGLGGNTAQAAERYAVFDNSGNKLTTDFQTEGGALSAFLADSKRVPLAPFVTDTKAWASLAMKRAIMMAVEEGHDKIAIITGEQAAGLYSLDKHVGAIDYSVTGDQNYHIAVYDQVGSPVGAAIPKSLDAESLENYVGKEMAKKIVENATSETQSFTGLDLKVGGEGMRAFYDQIIPQVARDVLKKLGGGQLQDVVIGGDLVDVYDKQGSLVAETIGRDEYEGAWEGSRHEGRPSGVRLSQIGFTITDSMREKVASGVPLFSKGRTTGDYGRAYTAEQQEMFKNTGRTVAPQTLIERVKEARSDMWKKMAQGIVDQFRPIRDLGGDAYTLARLSKGSAGAFEALLNYGKLSIVDGAYDADMSGGFIKTIGEPLGAELEDFAWWVASNRAERLAVEDRENLFSRRDIDAGKSLAQGTLPKPYTKRDGTTTTDRAEAYADSLVKFNEFNKNVLDIAEQSGLIDGDARKIWENEFYVPFYRVSEEDGQFMGAKIKGGLARQRAFQELKGGSQKLNSDLLANTMKNWAHLIDASAKNRAAKATLEAAEKMNVALEADAETVRQLGKNIGGKGGTVWFMDGGQQRHFVVGDPHLLAAINSLEYAGLRGPLMDALSATKHWLTVGVTASPAFKVRNLIRDSLQAISVSDLSYNPIANMKDGIKASARDSQTYVSALASGGLIRFGTMMEGNGPERVRRLVQKGVNPSTILDSEAKIKAFYSKTIEPVVDAYNELGNRGEEINRAALYSQLRKQGKSHAEAALLSRDLMDFSMQGTWASIRFLTQVVPFLNARLQGLYKLGRGASEDPRKFAITTGAVAMVSIALMAAYADDDDWKKREDWDRNGNWWFKIGGVAFRIPKPFEIGAIGTLAERGVELFTNDEFTLKRFLSQVKHIMSDNLAMNPVPQAIKPIIDVYANKDAFSGRPIESMGMERLQSEYRYTANTSMVARGASTALNTISRNTIGEESLSPVQIDSMLRGYFGWLGTFIVGGADMLTRPLTNEPSRPQADYLKVVTQGIARQLPEPSSKYVSAVYDQAKILEQAYATHRQLIREGKVDDAREFAEDNADLLRRYRLVERVKGAQSQINRTIREIERSDKDPKTKREEIQALRERQSRIASEVY